MNFFNFLRVCPCVVCLGSVFLENGVVSFILLNFLMGSFRVKGVHLTGIFVETFQRFQMRSAICFCSCMRMDGALNAFAFELGL